MSDIRCLSIVSVKVKVRSEVTTTSTITRQDGAGGGILSDIYGTYLEETNQTIKFRK